MTPIGRVEKLLLPTLVLISACLLLWLGGAGYGSNPPSPGEIRMDVISPPNQASAGPDLPPPTKLQADLEDSTVLNIHVVPHTHDDVGWLKTVEQYFYGLNMTIQHACVNDILDSVVSSLLEHPARTFTYVEQKFFSMWWKLQDDAVKDSVRYLVANKQLSFVNGGWCMHDEAATHFMGMIDQTTLGHRFLKKELGVIPKVGWQLDPFGHSATQSSLFTSKTGLDALYFGRIDYQDLNKRHFEKDCEGVWNSSRNLPDTSVFWGLTGGFSGNYGAPQGYCWDVNCEDTFITDLNQHQLEASMHKLLEMLRVQSDQTKGNHIMMTMGSDFQFQRAHVNFANLDLMISTITEMQRLNKVDIPAMFGPRFDKVNIFYSSPNYYTECKYRELKASGARSTNDSIKYSIKQDDFMPYSDCEHCFWTGYFTSRAGLKRLERVSSSFLLAARQIESMLDYTGKHDPFHCQHAFDALEDAVGVAQHHDGVSGTSKQHVANDYAKRLQIGIDRVTTCTTRKLRRLFFGGNATGALPDLTFCQLLNETKCDISERATQQNNTDVYVVVYNGLAQEQNSIIHLPVSSKAMYSVEEIGMNQSVVDTAAAIPSFGDVGAAPYRIAFQARKVPPLGAKVYKVAVTRDRSKFSLRKTPLPVLPREQERKMSEAGDEGDVVLANEYFSAIFDGTTGAIKKLNMQNTSMKIGSEWGYYTSFDHDLDAPDEPNNNNNRQNSGAYIFRPSTTDQKPIILKQISATFYNTTAGTEVHARFEVPWIKTVTRVMNGQPFLEVTYSVGPIPISDGRGKEIITRLTGQVTNDGIFYTDSNGREFLERKLNHRPTWNLNVFEPVAGNYYPVNAAIYIEDSLGAAMAVATDRSQGGASLLEGSIELMVQRRTLADDWRGVFEPMNETDGGITPCPPYGNATRLGDGVIIKGTHYIRIGNEGGAKLARSMMDQAFVNPLVFVGSAPNTKTPDFVASQISGLKQELPSNVMLITRALLYGEPNPTFLLRVGHQYGAGEDKEFSKPVSLDLASLLPGYEIVDVVETTLSGNQNIDDWKMRRLDWAGVDSASGDVDKSYKSHHPHVLQTDEITLESMDIRTFLVQVK